ncbi:MAG TPA: VOC family protein [Steroidobacteraceae bacterium]|jgi:catechol 2,3-dioxygenase-like lactoylglutathione lyase family enzyme|nr:VOC family protein [Steroidobacteraceae bacterium]
MSITSQSSRDIIIRTDRWPEAIAFYEGVLGFRVIYRSQSLVGFETGAFCLYVEKGPPHGPVLDFLTPDVTALRDTLLAAGCRLVEENPTVPRCYLQDPFGITFNLGTESSGR